MTSSLMKRSACILLATIAGLAQAQPAHRCAGAAGKQAAKLLAFHVGPDLRGDVEKGVKTLAPLRNPADRKQMFDVLEVPGGVEKARYRMRFIYAQVPGDCVLMGQEIMEDARL